MLGKKTVLADGCLTLNPSGTSHRVLLNEQWANKLITFSGAEPVPNFGVQFFRAKIAAILLMRFQVLLCGRHVCAQETSGSVSKIYNRQLMATGVACSNTLGQSFLFGACSRPSATAHRAILGHEIHLF
jgi:hypothetical protein